MADDDVLNAEVGQHVSADLAGEGTGLLKVDVLGADVDVGALGHLDSGDEIGEGNADDDLAAGVLDSGDQLADEGLGLGSGLVHFPVAGDDSFTILFIHGDYSFHNKPSPAGEGGAKRRMRGGCADMTRQRDNMATRPSSVACGDSFPFKEEAFT